MRLALIFPPYSHKVFAENLKIVDNRFGLFPPLNLLYAASFLKQADHSVMVVDAHARRMTPEQCLRLVRGFNPDMLCFNVATYMFHDTLRWIRLLKEWTSLPVLAGGLNMAAYPMESMSHPEIDFGISGEAKPAAIQFLEAYAGGGEYENIAGLAYRRDGKLVFNPPAKDQPDFDSFPFPAREEVDNSLYFEHISQRRNFTIGLTQTGCPYNCTFCAVPAKRYSARSVENILAEIDECAARHGIREIDYFDAAFTVNRKRTAAFCEGLILRRLDISWSCRTRIDCVDGELLSLMSRSGCARIYFGIETPEKEILSRMGKTVPIEKIGDVLSMCRKVSIRPLGFFMIGSPGETRQSVLHTINFARSLPLDYAQFSRTIAKPQSELHRLLALESGEDYWKDFTLGRKDEERLPAPWTELSEKEILSLTRKAYFSFYFRPGIILRALFRLKSFEELKRYFVVSLMMIFNSREKNTKAE